MEKVIKEIKINGKGLEILTAMLRKYDDIKSADLLESRDEKFIEYWNDYLTRHTSYHDGKLIGCDVVVGDWRTEIYCFSLQLSDFDIVFGEEFVEDFL